MEKKRKHLSRLYLENTTSIIKVCISEINSPVSNKPLDGMTFDTTTGGWQGVPSSDLSQHPMASDECKPDLFQSQNIANVVIDVMGDSDSGLSHTWDVPLIPEGGALHRPTPSLPAGGSSSNQNRPISRRSSPTLLHSHRDVFNPHGFAITRWSRPYSQMTPSSVLAYYQPTIHDLMYSFTLVVTNTTVFTWSLGVQRHAATLTFEGRESKSMSLDISRINLMCVTDHVVKLIGELVSLYLALFVLIMNAAISDSRTARS